MAKIIISKENDRELVVANHSPGSAINFILKTVLKIAICSYTTELYVVGRQAFLSSFKKKTEVVIFPQAKLIIRVNETNGDCVIWVNIQRKIKVEYGLHNSHFNFLTY